MAEPQITDIAACLTARLPEDGMDPAESKESWRRALRQARSAGVVEWLTGLVEQEAAGDPEVREACEALRDRGE